MKPKSNSKTDIESNLSERPISGALMQGLMCADSMDGVGGEEVSLGPCHGQGRNQVRTSCMFLKYHRQLHWTILALSLGPCHEQGRN